MVRVLFVLHDPPYGTDEGAFNGLRWAAAVAKDAEVRVFLFGDSIAAGVTGQRVPNGSDNTGKQVASLAGAGVVVGACSSCLDARGIDDERLLDGVHRSSLAELTEWTGWAEKVINV